MHNSKRVLAVAAAAALALSASACSGTASNHKPAAAKHVHSEIYQGADGMTYTRTPRAANDTSTTDMMIWWMLMSNNSGTSPNYSGSQVSGGSWSRVSGPPPSVSTLTPTGRTVTLDEKADPTTEVKADTEVQAANEAKIDENTPPQEAQQAEQDAANTDTGNNGDNGGAPVDNGGVPADNGGAPADNSGVGDSGGSVGGDGGGGGGDAG